MYDTAKPALVDPEPVLQFYQRSKNMETGNEETRYFESVSQCIGTPLKRGEEGNGLR
jgi:hypothetical protein